MTTSEFLDPSTGTEEEQAAWSTIFNKGVDAVDHLDPTKPNALSLDEGVALTLRRENAAGDTGNTALRLVALVGETEQERHEVPIAIAGQNYIRYIDPASLDLDPTNERDAKDLAVMGRDYDNDPQTMADISMIADEMFLEAA